MYCCLCNRNILRRKHGTSGPSVGGEYIEIKMMADANGNLHIPVAGNSGLGDNNTYGALFNWDVFVSGVAEGTFSGNSGRQKYITVASGKTPGTLYNIRIQPHYIDPETRLPQYLWASAFGMGGSCVASLDLRYKNPVADELYEIVYDGCLMGYKVSETNAGSGYKTAQYAGCSNLRRARPEVDASMITSCGNHYLAGQYCQSGIIESVAENVPALLNAHTGFREQQYWGCTNLTTAATERDPVGLTTGLHSYREGQYGKCTSLVNAAPENPPAGISGGDEFKYNQYLNCTSLQNIPRVEYCAGYGTSQFRGLQFNGCGSPAHPITARLYGSQVIQSASNSLGLANANVYKIYVPEQLLSAYRNSSNWSNIDDDKFVGFRQS